MEKPSTYQSLVQFCLFVTIGDNLSDLKNFCLKEAVTYSIEGASKQRGNQIGGLTNLTPMDTRSAWSWPTARDDEMQKVRPIHVGLARFSFRRSSGSSRGQRLDGGAATTQRGTRLVGKPVCIEGQSVQSDDGIKFPKYVFLYNFLLQRIDLRL